MATSAHGAAGKLATIIIDVVGQIPISGQCRSEQPISDARRVSKTAAKKAAVTAGTLSLPPGPWGWLALVPELLAVWRIQAQMVADIAALFGHSASLGREQMIYCLFRHTAAQAVRDLAVRLGDRLLVRRASLQAIQRIAKAIGIKIAQCTLGKALSRWIPLIGALGVGSYAYFDTDQVADAALELFSQHFDSHAK